MRVVVVLLVGCAGEAADDGGADSGGEPADPIEAEPAAGLVWVDATGEVVDGVVQIGESLKYADGDGYLWPVDPWSAEMVPESLLGSEWSALNLPIVYADAGCEEPWVSYLRQLPRVVQIVSEELADSPVGNLDRKTFVLPDDVDPALQAGTGFERNGAGCDEAGPVLVMPVDELIEVEPPSLSWVPPLHAEWR